MISGGELSLELSHRVNRGVYRAPERLLGITHMRWVTGRACLYRAWMARRIQAGGAMPLPERYRRQAIAVAVPDECRWRQEFPTTMKPWDWAAIASALSWVAITISVLRLSRHSSAVAR